MNIALRKPMTVEQFLAWEERQELRWEFDGVEPVAMTGGTDAHEAIGGVLRALLRERLRGKPCRVRGPTLKIEVAGRFATLTRSSTALRRGRRRRSSATRSWCSR